MADDPLNPQQTPTGTPTPITPTPTDTTPPSDASLTDGTSSALDKAIGTPAPKDPPAPKADDAAAPPTPAAPEKYADFTLPEGVTLDEATLGEATAIFREAKLPQETAQKLVDMHTKAVKATADGIGQMWRDTQDAWVDELNSDPKIGKSIQDGTVGASIATMLTHLPVEQSTAFRQAMNFTGAGNNPAIVRALFELSKKFSEPGHVQGAPAAQAKTRPTAAQALYPSSPPAQG